MIGPGQNPAIVRWLRRHSRQPIRAPTLWAEPFTALRRDTGEVMLTCDEPAERVGTDPDTVCRIMGELAKAGAVITRRERMPGVRGPGRAVYFMNPRVGTHLAGAARDKAQAKAPALRLVEPA